MNSIILETTRVILREFLASDSHLLKDLDSDPEVMKYLTDGRPSTDEEIATTTQRILALKDKHQGKFGIWLAFEKTNQEFMGWYLFRPDKKTPDDVKNIELGYRLKKKFWGQGYASEVSKAIIKKGFSEYKLDSIFAITMAKNLGSQGVMKKIGLKWVSNYTENDFPGEDKSAVKFAITAAEWSKLAV